MDVCVLLGRSSDGLGELGECSSNPSTPARFHTEFVVASAEVLHERVTSHDRPRTAISLKSTHGPQPGLESAVVGLDPIVRILDRVMERGRDELIDRGA